MRALAFAALGLAVGCERAGPHSGIVATVDEVRLDGSLVLSLNEGRVSSGDRTRYAPPNQGERDVALKLKTALHDRCSAARPLELRLDGALLGETFFILISTAGAANCTNLVLTVHDQPWRIPHQPFAGKPPSTHVELRATMTDADLVKLAAPLVTAPPPDGALVIVHAAVSVRQIMLFAQATPPAMRRVYAFDRD